MGMRRTVLLLASIALAVLLVSGVGWAQAASPDTTAQAGPSNDNLSGAKSISLYQLSHEGPWSYGNNYNATRQPGEPSVTKYNSVWYRWTPPRSGKVYILVDSKMFDEKVSVWTGPRNDVRKLRLKAANDDWWLGNILVSEVEFYARGGTPLWIAVSGYYPGAEGRFGIEGAYASLRNP
jgi:hypothetical protein